MENITAVVLAGKRDFGRCPVASSRPVALWPVLGKSVLQRLIDALAEQGVPRIVVCSESESKLLRSNLECPVTTQVQFLDEGMPRGTAGCIRLAADHLQAGGGQRDRYLVVQAAILTLPRLSEFTQSHREHQGIMTVAYNPPRAGSRDPETAGIYLCEPDILEFIPEEGFYDIKESLLTDLIRRRKSIFAHHLKVQTGKFRDKDEYLCALSEYLYDVPRQQTHLLEGLPEKDHNLWIAPTARVHSTARLIGPLAILPDVDIRAGALIFGPAVIGAGVRIGSNALVESSVIWQGSRIGANSQIQRSLIAKAAFIPEDCTVADQTVAAGTKPQRLLAQTALSNSVGPSSRKKTTIASSPLLGIIYRRHRNSFWFALLAIGVCSGIAYSGVLKGLLEAWISSDEYSAGAWVPLLAVALIWTRRFDLARCPVRPRLYLGMGCFLLAQVVALFGMFFMFRSLERLALVLTIGALMVMILGFPAFKYLGTVWLFLFLMLPLPNRVQSVVTLPLQQWATNSAVFSLEMIGYDIQQQGNIINLRWSPEHPWTTVAIAEACNGLRMVTAFVIICALIVLLVRRPRWLKALGLMAAFPIALLCNSVRLCLTSVAMSLLEGPEWERLFHDWGGLAMMPLALVMMLGWLWTLDHLVLSETLAASSSMRSANAALAGHSKES